MLQPDIFAAQAQSCGDGSRHSLSASVNTARILKLDFVFAFILSSCIFILLLRKSDQSAITSSLGSCWPPVYHSKMGGIPPSAFPNGTSRAGARALDVGGPSVYQGGGGQSLKLSTKAAVFKRKSLLIGGPSKSIGGAGPPFAPALGTSKLAGLFSPLRL